MESISFLTPVDFCGHSTSIKDSLLERVDNYFYLGGKKAHVIPGVLVDGSQGVVIADVEQSLFKTCVKVATYFTLVLPVLLFTLKIILRGFSDFHIVERHEPSRSNSPEPEQEFSIDEPDTPQSTTRSRSEINTNRSTREEKTETIKDKALKMTPPPSPKKPPLSPAKQLIADVEGYIKRATQYIFIKEEDSEQQKEVTKMKASFEEALTQAKKLDYPLNTPVTEANLEAWEKVMTSITKAIGWSWFPPGRAVRLEADRIYCCLAEAYFSLGKREKALEMVCKIHGELSDPFFSREAEALNKASNRDAAVEMAVKVKNEDTQAALLIPFAESYYQEGNLVKALLTAEKTKKAPERKSFLDKIQKEMKPLARKKDGTLVIGSIEEGSKAIDKTNSAAIMVVYFAIIANHYYSEGQLVKALVTIKSASHGVRESFLASVAKENKPLARKEDGTLVIGSIEEGSKVIDNTNYVAIMNVYLAIIANHYYSEGELVKALVMIKNASHNIKESFLASVAKENKPLARKEDGTLVIGSIEEGSKVIDNTNYVAIMNVYFAIIANHYYSEGELVKALVMIKSASHNIKESFLASVAKENKPLARKEDGTLVIGSIEEGSKVITNTNSYAIMDVYFTIIANHYCSNGELVKALLAIKNATTSSRAIFLEMVLKERDALVGQNKGFYLYGSLETSSQEIEKTNITAIKDTYYLLVALDLIRNDIKEEAQKYINKISSSDIKKLVTI